MNREGTLRALLASEIEFRSRLRKVDISAVDVGQLHAAWSIDNRYEDSIRLLGAVTPEELERARRSFDGEAEPCDVQTAQGVLGRIFNSTSVP